MSDSDSETDESSGPKLGAVFEQHYAEVKEAMTAAVPDVIAVQCVRNPVGIDSDDSRDSASDIEADVEARWAALDAETAATGRFVAITRARASAVTAAEKALLGDQYNSPILGFTTRFSYDVDYQLTRYLKKIKRAQTNAEKFDLLFGLTVAIDDHDTWLYDHEYDFDVGGKMKMLAKAWREALRCDDAALGIDAAHSRPGVLSFLAQFKKKVEACGSEPVVFKYAP